MSQEFYDHFLILFQDSEDILRRLLQQKLRTIQKCKKRENIIEKKIKKHEMSHIDEAEGHIDDNVNDYQNIQFFKDTVALNNLVDNSLR